MPKPTINLQRRAFLILILCSALNLALVAAWVMDFSTMPTALGLALLIIWLLCGVWILLVGLAPFRRLEAEQNVGRTISLSKALLAIAVASALLALTRRLTGDSWDNALGVGVGVGTYFIAFQLFARIQRIGIVPYLRPAWYVILGCGIAAGIVYAAITDQAIATGAVVGGTWSLMHYGYIRWAMRDVPAPAA